MGPHPTDEVTALVALLEGGKEPAEGELVRILRRPSCPGRLVEALAQWRFVISSHRLLPLVVRHPSCPRHLAWDALPHLGWHDLLEVCRDLRTPAPVRRQGERKLLERTQTLTLGERAALARRAPRAVISALVTDADPVCIEALLGNPQFTEADALRLLHGNRNPDCVLALLHHPQWGRRLEVLRAAVRSERVPLGVALGLAAALPGTELEGLAAASEVRARIREAAGELLRRRRGTAQRARRLHPLELR